MIKNICNTFYYQYKYDIFIIRHYFNQNSTSRKGINTKPILSSLNLPKSSNLTI